LLNILTSYYVSLVQLFSSFVLNIVCVLCVCCTTYNFLYQAKRSVTVNITNKLKKKLVNPKVLFKRGVSQANPEEIEPNQTKTLRFEKKNLRFSGVECEVMYTIHGTSHKAILYFDNPMFARQVFGLSWCDSQQHTTLRDLKKWRKGKLKKKTNMWAVDRSIEIRKEECNGYIVQGSMNNHPDATFDVEFKDKTDDDVNNDGKDN